MKAVTKTLESPVYEQSIYGDGIIVQGKLLKIETITITEIEADADKTIRRISDGVLLDKKVTLGTEDSISNYEEV